MGHAPSIQSDDALTAPSRLHSLPVLFIELCVEHIAGRQGYRCAIQTLSRSLRLNPVVVLKVKKGRGGACSSWTKTRISFHRHNLLIVLSRIAIELYFNEGA